ncbi:replication protein [Pseudomonas aeruginosa]|uniref:replication protein n=1 Tax=Pseudomonas aeruginosa TaxID=287 RepID=UPI000B105582|nr:replication protein [Pseudomonas aeruginosa]MCG0475681.1 replication protein [Pseudomonas aeruginosa]WJQ19035.1 replication protein [Pseudomonas aeruginosa]HBO3548796.1 replication protein [Pseudomonas aeruginosa]HCL3749953.1 replication protein [Pseudomonas aeruginosa]HEP7905259.1 replication protein [Pseudomonas aeruginosa]
METSTLPLFSAVEEASLFHEQARTGYFSLLVQQRSKMAQSSHPLSKMDKVLPLVDPLRDTWISQAEFIRPNRRVVNLARIGLLFADLDTYRLSWSVGRTPEQLAESVLYYCRLEGIPAPSLLIYSGRGIQAKWLLDGALPRHALPRWNACQRYLVDRLTSLGADLQAKDASRVLRLVDTVNTKSGNVCRVVHVETNQRGEPACYSFEYLAEVLLPVARWTIEQQRRERKERQQLKVLLGGKYNNLRSFSSRQLAWHRLEDLRTLAVLRGGVREGERMKHLFWRLNFLLLSGATHSSQMFHESAALAFELDPSWSYSSRELMTLYSKAKEYEAGKRITLGGKNFAPLYTPKNDTLINLYQITSDEQRHLRTIIDSGIAAERHRKRETVRRRAAGAVDRETYENGSLNRQKPWETFGMSRASWYRAGKPTNL